MDETNNHFFFQKINSFYEPKLLLLLLLLLLFHYLLWYCHMKSEIIQIVACDNYGNFQHLSFVFSTKKIKLVSLF